MEIPSLETCLKCEQRSKHKLKGVFKFCNEPDVVQGKLFGLRICDVRNALGCYVKMCQVDSWIESRAAPRRAAPLRVERYALRGTRLEASFSAS